MAFYFLFREQTEEGINQRSILEQKHCRNISYAELLRGQGVFVNIQFGDFDSPRVF